MTAWESIPGETPIPDISGLKVKGISTRRALNVAEADNIRRAIARYLAARPTARQAPFTVPWMLKLHKEMFGRVWSWAGILRTTTLNIGPMPAQVETALYNLAEDLVVWRQSNIDMMEQAAMLHHRAVSIHPLLNGNGRWARLLANIWLRRAGGSSTRWPEETVGSASLIRDPYLDAIRAADAGNLQPLVELHRKYGAAWRT